MNLMRQMFSLPRLPGAILAVACLLLAACSSSSLNGSPTANVAAGQFAQVGSSQPKALDGATAANAQKIFAANAATAGNSDDYKIAGLDVLEVTVMGVPELTRTVQVSTSGTISLPLIKTVKAGGRTQGQLEHDITTKLAATYLQAPQVSVFVKEYNSQRITVDGAVTKPGIFQKNGNVSLIQAIALAEGLSATADPTGILVFRTVGDKRMAARFDIKQIRSGKIGDPMLQAGDIVMVDESSGKAAFHNLISAMPMTGLFSLLAL